MVRKSISLLSLALAVLLLPGRVSASPEFCHASQATGPPQETIHVVQRGETLFSIAQRYGSTVDALAHANGLHDPTRIYVGQRLTIPGTDVDVGPQATTSYIVQPGDSLMGIARRHATSWQSLARLNVLISPDVLYPGQVLRVPAAASVGGQSGGLHIVGEGETLLHVALRYDVPLRSLISANHLRNPALTYWGQPLLVPHVGMSGLPLPFLSVDVRPLPVGQGRSLVVTARTQESVELVGRFSERVIRFAEENGVYYGLAAVHVFSEPGLYEMTLQAIESDGRVTEITVDVVVEAEQFGYERIRVSQSLLDPALVAEERQRLDALRPRFTDERAWSGPFEPPCGGTISSYFGTRRAYNEGPYTSYHGGVDLRGVTGTPVYAPTGGTVVLADQLVVRGNALVLDHGWGVLTGYWHLSAIEAQVGQRVEQGDLIGRIGNTGLSTGSHLHWEMWVGGVSVSPLQWLDPFYPWPEREEELDDGDAR
jgi:murein DD-endopeptidase MepM/ murein hydrolase activator NlpD